MKLRNKADGRVREFGIDETKSFPYYLRDDLGNTYCAKTLKEIADKWEDIEEPKEEAELAVRKLKAWKRLRDKGFSFHGYDDGYKHDFNSGHIEFYVKNSGDVLADLDLLFSGEDD